MGLLFQLPIHVSIFMSELPTFCFVIQIIGAPCSYSPDLLDNKQASNGLWKSVRDGLDWQSMPRCWSVNTCNGLGSLCIVHFACFVPVVANAYTCKASWFIGMDETPREAVFLWKSRFQLPALRSALLFKAQLDLPWSTCKCTGAGRSVGTI